MGGIGGSQLQFLDTLNWTAGDGGGGGDEKKEESSSTTLQELTDYIVDLPSTVEVQNPPCDFTPAKYITLLFTDLGVLTPSAVSDELIRLYQ
jgi:translation initiation factor 2B subunit (eIF-2B alpha/beta/delta family)